MENEVLMEMEISKLYHREWNTCSILSTIFMEKDTTQSNTDFCENNTVWM